MSWQVYVRDASEIVNPFDDKVTSVFVNPTAFSPPDSRLCGRAAPADVSAGISLY